MTDQDNLRNRIAAQITPFPYWNYADWEGADERDKADARQCAQAIIDELGLTVESGVVFRKVTREGVWMKSDPLARIVGKWEVEQ